MRVRTNNTIEFAYKPSEQESIALQQGGMGETQSKQQQYYTVTAEGADLPDAVGVYALNLYGPQMVEVEVKAEATSPPSGRVELTTSAEIESLEDAAITTAALVAGVQVTGEGEDQEPQEEQSTPAPGATCPDCNEVFTAATPAAAKGKLTKHTRLVHVG